MVLKLLSLLFFENIRKNDPIVGNNISDDKIGKFINIKSKKLIMLKNQVTS